MITYIKQDLQDMQDKSKNPVNAVYTKRVEVWVTTEKESGDYAQLCLSLTGAFAPCLHLRWRAIFGCLGLTDF